MAEIKIEKKKPVWPWILAALAVLLVLFLVFSGSDDDVDMEDRTTTTDTLERENDMYATGSGDAYTSNEGSREVNEYVTHVRDSEERMGLNHNYTETALDRLANAVERKAERHDVDVSNEMDRIDNITEYLNEDTYKTQHADSIRVAFEQINNSLERIDQQAQHSSADIQELRNRADAVRTGTQTLEQKDAVRNYFDKAAEVLQQMDRSHNQNGQNNMNQTQGTNQNQGTGTNQNTGTNRNTGTNQNQNTNR